MFRIMQQIFFFNFADFSGKTCKKMTKKLLSVGAHK